MIVCGAGVRPSEPPVSGFSGSLGGSGFVGSSGFSSSSLSPVSSAIGYCPSVHSAVLSFTCQFFPWCECGAGHPQSRIPFPERTLLWEPVFSGAASAIGSVSYSGLFQVTTSRAAVMLSFSLRFLISVMASVRCFSMRALEVFCLLWNFPRISSREYLWRKPSLQIR